MKWAAPILAVVAMISGTGCTFVTANANAETNATGELWYVKTTMVLQYPVWTRVYYCPASDSVAVRCTEAVLVSDPSAVSAEEEHAPPHAEEESVSSVEPDLSKAFWNAATAVAGGDDACAGVAELLAKDESCDREQCRAPLALSALFLAKCTEDKDAFAAVKKLRDTWRKQATDEPTDCSRALYRVARSHAADMAKKYGAACLGSREASHVEQAILDGAK